MANLKRIRGSGVKINKFGSWVVKIKILGEKRDKNLGSYSDENIARQVKTLAENFYWDNDESVKNELETLMSKANPNTPPPPVKGHTFRRESGKGITKSPQGNWKTAITINSKQISLGTYTHKEDAQAARCLGEKIYWQNDSSLITELEKLKNKQKDIRLNNLC
jgi:hypothetical protein